VFGSIEARHKLAVAPCTMICYFFFMYRRNNQRKMMGPLHPAEYVLRAYSDSRAGRAEALPANWAGPRGDSRAHQEEAKA
jgi:hypothetical protein